MNSKFRLFAVVTSIALGLSMLAAGSAEARHGGGHRGGGMHRGGGHRGHRGRGHYGYGGPVYSSPTYVASRPASSNGCLSKEYNEEGYAVFKDNCTNEFAVEVDPESSNTENSEEE